MKGVKCKSTFLSFKRFFVCLLFVVSCLFSVLSFTSGFASAASTTPISTDLYYKWQTQTVVSHKHNPTGNILDSGGFVLGWIETVNFPYSTNGKVGFSFDFDITFRSKAITGFTGWSIGNRNYPCSLSSNYSGLSFAVSECNAWQANDSTYRIYHYTGKAVVSTTSGTISGTPQITFYLGSSNMSDSYILRTCSGNFCDAQPLQYNDTVISNFETYTDPNTAILNQQMQVMQETNQRLDQIQQQLNDRIYEIQDQNQQVINGQKEQTEAIKNQTEQQQNQYEQDKKEESDRENQGKEDSDKAQGIFNFSVLNPFEPLFQLFSPNDCVDIPTISNMVHSEDSKYCSWFPSSVRVLLTPVFGFASVMLLFGFVVRWLGGSEIIRFSD